MKSVAHHSINPLDSPLVTMFKLWTEKSLKILHYGDISQKDDIITNKMIFFLIDVIQEEINFLVIFGRDCTQKCVSYRLYLS